MDAGDQEKNFRFPVSDDSLKKCIDEQAVITTVLCSPWSIAVIDNRAINLYLKKCRSSIEVRYETKCPVDARIDERDSAGSVPRGGLL